MTEPKQMFTGVLSDLDESFVGQPGAHQARPLTSSFCFFLGREGGLLETRPKRPYH